jgi:epsilon-lactone hydrolase
VNSSDWPDRPETSHFGPARWLNDTFALAERLPADNVPVWVQVWHKAMHMFQLSFDVNPDARRAVDEVAAFIRHVTTVRDDASA